MPDAFFYTLEKVGLYGGIAVGSTLLLLWIIYRIMREKIEEHLSLVSKLDTTIELIRKAIISKDGEVISLEEHQRLLDTIIQKILIMETSSFDLLKKHIEDVERACNEERYISCDINRCVHFNKIVTQVEQMREHLRIFVGH